MKKKSKFRPGFFADLRRVFYDAKDMQGGIGSDESYEARLKALDDFYKEVLKYLKK